MCVKQIEHYTKVINSCETLEQLNAASGWILGGFKKMDAVAGNLNGARRKLCVSAIEATKSHVLGVNLSKGLSLFHKEIEGAFTPECSESEMNEKIGSIFEGLAEMFPGKVRCEVRISRKRSAAKDPVEGESSDAESPARERPEAVDPDPANPAEKPAESGAVS